MHTRTLSRRALTSIALASGMVLLGTVSASAHVTVSSPDASPGGYGKLVFRVPSESDTATTESVTVNLPTESPFSSIRTKPVPGWEVDIVTEKLDEPVESDGFELTRAVTEVTWTAEEGNGLESDEFAEFELSVGPIAEDVDTLVFPTQQRYSDGEVAEWTDPPTDGGAEPESPAPVLELSSDSTDDTEEGTENENGAEGNEAGSETGSEPTEEATVQRTAADTDESGTDTLARTLGGIGLVFGAVAVGVAVVSRRRQGG